MGENTVSDEELADFRVIDIDELPADIPASKFDPEVIRTATIEVTPAELKAINASPKVLAAAPGAGYVNDLVDAMLILDYESAAYANNGILGIYETDASGNLLSGTTTLASFLGKTEDTIVKLMPAQEASPSLVGQAHAENKALVLTQATGESITGDSPVTVHIRYRVLPTGL